MNVCVSEEVVNSAAYIWFLHASVYVVCVFRRRGECLMFSCVVLSLRLQQETGTGIVRSQGTIGGKVTIAQASSSLISVTGVTGSVLPLDVFVVFF